MSLSLGEFYKLIPKGPVENVRFRQALLARAKGDPVFQAGVREICRRDFLFFLSAFAWQYNPNAGAGGVLDKVGPFIPWEFQAEAARVILLCIEDRKDLVIEKSREMGASWLCLFIMLWMAALHADEKFLCVSRNEESVDKPGDSDSLFWKLDFAIERMPMWLIGPVERRKRSINFPRSGGGITGQATTEKAGVGGRCTAMFVDEFSQIREGFDVLDRTSDTTACRIFNGTHVGIGNAFHALTDESTKVGARIRKLKMHWTQHPAKTAGLYRSRLAYGRPDVVDTSYEFPADFMFKLDGSPHGGAKPGVRSVWYDDQCDRKSGPRAVAMDLDINAAGTTAQFFSASLIAELISLYAVPPLWEGEVKHDFETGEFLGLEKREGGAVKLWACPDGRGLLGEDTYCCGADISQGEGASPSCLSGVNGRTGEKVLEFADARLRPEAFARLCVAVCRWLYGAKLCWEGVGPGKTFGNTVIECGYRNVYHRRDEANPLKKHLVVDRPGWHPGNGNKLIELESYRSALESRAFLNRSEAALAECLLFSWAPTGKDVIHSRERNILDPSGATVNHADRVVADMLAWKLARDVTKAAKIQKAEAVQVGSLAWRRLIHRTGRRAED